MSEKPDQKRKFQTPVMIAAAVALTAAMMGLVIPSAAFVPATTTDSLTPRGYVTVEARHPDGTVFYHNEDHNLIVTNGVDFIAAQIASTSPGANGANYIGLTTNSKTPHADDDCLSTTDGGTTSAEITSGGLARSQGAYAHTNGQTTLTVTETFTASATHTSVQRGGLFTAAASGDTCAGGNDGTMLATTAFTVVTLQSGDQLTITWTVTIS